MSLSWDGFLYFSETLLMSPVKPIISENLAGGLFSSLIPQTRSAEGTPSPAYQTHFDIKILLVLASVEGVPSSSFKACAARSLLAALSAALSSFETCLRATCSEKKREGAENLPETLEWRPGTLDASLSTDRRIADIRYYFYACLLGL